MQTSYNGSTYTKGTLVDVWTTFNVICADTPFKYYPEAKPLATKDWVGQDGLEVYIPPQTRLKDYDWEMTFLYVGIRSNMRTNVTNFIKFLQGRHPGVDNAAVGSRLAMYEDYTQTGRKDIAFAGVEFDEWWDSPYEDSQSIASFKVKFHLYDPVTNATPTTTQNVITGLTWT